LYIKYNFSEEDKDIIKLALKEEKNSNIKERLQTVYMTMQNLKRYEVAKLLNKDKQFVGRWVKTYKKFGVDGLSENRGGANRHHLTKEQEEFIKDIVTNAQPADCSYSQPVWSGALIVDLIKNMYSATYTRNGVYALMSRLGVSYKKAIKVDPKKSHKVIQEWKELIKKT
jgi:transposase